MRNKHILVPLMIFATTLTACGSSTLHKPSFSRYKNVVGSSYFNNEISAAQNKYKNKYFNEDTMALKTGFKVSCVYSRCDTVTNYKTDKTYTIYEQKETDIFVNIRTQRYLINTTTATYVKGAVAAGFSEKEDTYKNVAKNKVYGEKSGSQLVEAKANNRSYRTMEYSDRYFLYYSLNDSYYYLESILYSNFSTDSDRFSYYIDGSVYTVKSTRNDDESAESYNYQGLTQIQYGRSISYKTKGVSTYTTSEYKQHRESYVDFTIKTDNPSISKLDYSNYSLVQHFYYY